MGKAAPMAKSTVLAEFGTAVILHRYTSLHSQNLQQKK